MTNWTPDVGPGTTFLTRMGMGDAPAVTGVLVSEPEFRANKGWYARARVVGIEGEILLESVGLAPVSQ